MKFVCAEKVLFGAEAFSQFGQVRVFPGEEIGPECVRDTTGLAIRSPTKVDHKLLTGSSVQFVGSATAGADNLDVDYLSAHGIAFCNAPGCNANSVAEYVVAALLEVFVSTGQSLENSTLGIIGAGHVGSAVAEKAELLGMQVLLNDPPLSAKTNDLKYRELEQVLAESDVITLHVPLTASGLWPTLRLADHRFFAQLKPGCVFINTARGDVVDQNALLLAIRSGVVAHTILDVWPAEPRYSVELAKCVDLATPHIAGYSHDGLLAGTIAIYREACHFFEVEATWSPPELPKISTVIECDMRGKRNEEVLAEVVRQVYDVRADDRKFRAGFCENELERAVKFVGLRRDYQVRREFLCASLELKNATPELSTKFSRLGFNLIATS